MTYSFDANDVLSVLAEDGKAYSFDATSNAITEGTTAVAKGSAEEKAAIKALTKGFKDFKEAVGKSAGHTDGHLKAFEKVATHYGASGSAYAADLTAIGESLGHAKTIATELTKTPPNKDVIINALVADGHSLNLVDSAGHTGLQAYAELPSVQKIVKRVNDLHTEIAAIEKSGVAVTEGAVEDLLRKHGTDINKYMHAGAKNVLNTGARVSVTNASAGVDFAKALTKIEGEITAATGRATTLLNNIANNTKTVENATFGWGTGALNQSIKDDVDAFNKLIKDNPKIQHHLHALIDGHAEKDLLGKVAGLKDSLSSISKAAAASPLATAATDAGQKTAKWIGGGKWYGFTHTAETVGEEVAKIGKFRWGKAAVLGLPVAAITTYFLAGTGNRGPSERAQAEMERRSAEPAMGRA